MSAWIIYIQMDNTNFPQSDSSYKSINERCDMQTEIGVHSFL